MLTTFRATAVHATKRSAAGISQPQPHGQSPHSGIWAMWQHVCSWSHRHHQLPNRVHKDQ